MLVNERIIYRVFDMLINFNENKVKVLNHQWTFRFEWDDGASPTFSTKKCCIYWISHKYYLDWCNNKTCLWKEC